MELWREKLEERSSEASVRTSVFEDSSGGTRGQLAGGTVEVQVAENFGRPSSQDPNVKNRTLKNRRVRHPVLLPRVDFGSE